MQTQAPSGYLLHENSDEIQVDEDTERNNHIKKRCIDVIQQRKQ